MTRNESRTESMREQNTREEEWTFEEAECSRHSRNCASTF